MCTLSGLLPRRSSGSHTQDRQREAASQTMSSTGPKRSAQSSGLSRSQWVAEAIRRQAAVDWPEDVLKSAGKFPDFPPREEATLPKDSPRIPW